jgi:lipopolysaccharide export system ATP-binding protein
MTTLRAQHLFKKYGTRTVVDDVSYSVEEGQIVGLLGRNGAGKSTSFNMTIGRIQADAGSVFFHDHDVTALPMYKRAQLGMGYLAQDPCIFENLSVENNLHAILETRRLTRTERKKRAQALLEQFSLTHVRHQAAHRCSGGEKRKLEIARALITEPRILMLDEPFANVDPISVDDLQREIKTLCRQTKISILVTDHNVLQTLKLVDHAYVIFEGKVFAQGTPKEIISNAQVKERYTGSLFKGDEFDTPAQAS